MSEKTSWLEKKFLLSKRGTTVQTEVLAGITTFLSCVSILMLNPAILSATGMDSKAIFWATALGCFVGCVWMGLYGNFPFALGPAMGLNSFFAFSMVLGMGVSWQNALACVFLSGCIFMLLSVFKVQQKIVDAVPDTIKKAIGAGVGMFIAFAGFQSAGIVAVNESTMIGIGNLGNPGTILAILGIVLTLVLVLKGVKAAILIGIIVVTVLGLFVTDPATGLPYTSLPSAIVSFDNPIEAMAPTFGKLSFTGMFDGNISHVLAMIFCIISFLFVDLFDSLGVFLGIAPKAGLVEKDGTVPGAGKALFVSAGAAAVGAVLGTSTITIYGAESATGIQAGGRTGLTACTTGICFLLMLIFSPLFLIVPGIATAPALIMVGIFMISNVATLDMNDITVAAPTFMALAVMPFTYNIAYGVLFSVLTYTICMLATGRKNEISKTLYGINAFFLLYFVLDCIF